MLQKFKGNFKGTDLAQAYAEQIRQRYTGGNAHLARIAAPASAPAQAPAAPRL